MRDKEFSDIVSERFDGFGDTPSDAVWENIAGNLDGRKKRLAILWWTCSFAAVLAVFVLAFDSFNGNSNGIKTVTASTSTSNETQENKKRASNELTNKVERQDNANSASVEKLNAEHDFKPDQTPNENAGQKTNLKQIPFDASTADKLRNELLPKINFETLPKGGLVHYLPLPPEIKKNGTLAEVQKANEEDSVSSLDYSPLSRIPMGSGENDIISGVQILPQPKWRIGARLTGFINASQPAQGIQNDANQVWNDPSSFTPNELKTLSHIRYAEIEVYTLYHLRSRFQLGGGISFSKGRDGNEAENYRTVSNRTTVGIPLYGRFTVLKTGRFQVSAELALLNEYSYIRSKTDDLSPPSGTPFPSDTSQALTEFGPTSSLENGFNNHGYAFGFQGGLETSFQLLPRMKLTGAIGYRNYLLERYSEVYNYVRNPGYITGSLGVRWMLR